MQSALFTLESPDIAHGGSIANRHVFNGFGYAGNNVSPALVWKNAPEGTKSFALMVHDPDAPTGGAGFWHWVVVNIPAHVSELKAGSGDLDGSKLVAGASHINTDFGMPGWGGPCPPTTDPAHRYEFTLYALPVEKLDLPPNATASLTGFVINMQSIGKASFTGMFGA